MGLKKYNCLIKMIERKIEDYKTNKGVILRLKTNEFCIYNREDIKTK